MRKFTNISSLTKTSVWLMLLLVASSAARRALAQNLPLVFNAESTCATFSKPAFAPFAQLPAVALLPDPFVFLDGSGRDTTFENWERHRCDYKAAIENYEIGPKPDPSDVTLTSSWTPSSPTDGVLTVVVTRKSNQRSLTLTSHIVFPSLPGGTVPAVISMALFPAGGANTGSIPSAVFTNRGVATVEYLHNQVTTYAGGQQIAHTQDPFYLLYPELCAGTCSGTSNAGQYAAWAWGVSRLIDGLYLAAANSTAANPFPIDLTHLAVTGCSYAGKMALFSGAFDERVALTIAQESGGGGMPSWRVSRAIEPAGSVEDIDTTDYSWFAQQLRQFGGDNVTKLPEDHHELMAMVLPRALLVTGNTDFTWLSNRSGYIDDRATQQIYQTFAIGDRFGFYIDGGHAHCAVTNNEIPSIQAFVDRFQLDSTTVNTNVEVNPFAGLNFQQWTSSWGTTGNPPPGGDFSLAAAPASVSVIQGSSSASTITIMPTGGFTGTPTLTAAGLPSGVTAGFNGNIVTFTAAPNAPVTAIPATVTITGSSGQLSHAISVAVSITPAAPPGGDFSLAAAPASVSVIQGSSSASTITIMPTGGFTGTPTLTAAGLPSGVTASFNGNIVTFTAAPDALVTTTAATVIITGSSGQLSHTTSVAVSITPAAQTGGSVGAVTVINSASPYFDDEGIKITNAAPITALTVTITVQDTGGLRFSSQYNTVGGSIAQSHNGLTYTFTLSAGQTLSPGSFLFDAQVGASGTPHSAAGDTYTATGTAGGAPFGLSGHF